jgi:ribosome biogenesis GTPase / thiamine phosphate phosphatase
VKGTGLVVARYRRHVTVEDEKGESHRCLTRGRSIKPLPGDEVVWHMEEDGTPIVDAIEPRRSTLLRIDAAGRPEAVAANISQLLIVTAPVPSPDWFLVDRYLVAAELMALSAAIIWNKLDLGEAESAPLGVYRSMGYGVFATSTKTHAGIDALQDAMRGQRSVLVGQSGVGKSSLLNALLGTNIQSVGDLGSTGGHGRHTTTTAVLYHLDDADLIDSPGVRHYAPYLEETAAADRGFRDFAPYLGACRFADCRHADEPGCAVKEAVAAGDIAARRYDNYRKLADRLETLHRRRDGGD